MFQGVESVQLWMFTNTGKLSSDLNLGESVFKGVMILSFYHIVEILFHKQVLCF